MNDDLDVWSVLAMGIFQVVAGLVLGGLLIKPTIDAYRSRRRRRKREEQP